MADKASIIYLKMNFSYLLVVEDYLERRGKSARARYKPVLLIL